MKISFIFAWYDLWVGLFYDKKKKWLYILPLPFVGIVVKFERRKKCKHDWQLHYRCWQDRYENYYCMKCHAEKTLEL